MAVLQISKIQVRRGQKSQSGIPTLSAGEFAWAVDAQELYIGNGSVSEGAPAVGNTRLLTELDASNIFKLAGTYAYEGNTSATIITGADANSPVSRTLQDKLDDYVSLADFGAVGDGVANDTKALQRAIDQIYLNSDKGENSNHQNRKKLRFPAGTYKITGTIYIPSYATIEGDGIDRTVIKQATTASAIFQTMDLSSTPSARVLYPSIQGGTNQPKNISLSGMTLQYDEILKQGSAPLVYVDCALDTSIKQVKFVGLSKHIDGSPYPDSDAQDAIQIRGQGTPTTKNLTVKECVFYNIAYGLTSNYDVTNINIFNNKFDFMKNGIFFADNVSGLSPQRTGPTNVLISGNTFENTFGAAIFGGQNPSKTRTNFISENNKFYNCGNELDPNTEENQIHPVVDYNGNGYRSVNDQFSRTDANLSGAVGTIEPEIYSNVAYQPTAARTLELSPSTTPKTVAIISKLDNTEVKVTVDYIARQPSLNVTRVGQVNVMTNLTTATWTDSFQYVGASSLTGDIQFSASLNTLTNTLAVLVTNPVGSVDTNFVYNYNLLY